MGRFPGGGSTNMRRRRGRAYGSPRSTPEDGGNRAEERRQSRENQCEGKVSYDFGPETQKHRAPEAKRERPDRGEKIE